MPREPETRLAFSTGGGGEAAPETKVAPAAAGRLPGIRLRLERRASGRLATLVTGLPGAAAEVAGLAKALKSSCAAGGTLRDGVLELQGDQRERIEAALRARGLKSKRAGG